MRSNSNKFDRVGEASIKSVSRANKLNSVKRIFPAEYISDPKNSSFVKETAERSADIASALISIGINLLNKKGILERGHVCDFLRVYEHIPLEKKFLDAKIPDDERDILGLVYQCALREGRKNASGSYYTPYSAVSVMMRNLSFSRGESFLDPCCGSGAFLLAANSPDPEKLTGVDNDETAVMIAGINLLLKYSDTIFTPRVYCADFLRERFDFEKFDYIATNPPWGAVNSACENIGCISSGETFSLFYAKAFGFLREGGIIRFLFPRSILNVRAHKDIRRFMAENGRIISMTAYDDMFCGVSTKYVDIQCAKLPPAKFFDYREGENTRKINISSVYETKNFVFNLLSDADISIINNVKSKGKYSLKDSLWALGIVTGANKSKLSPEKREGMEQIYTGKEISPYVLKPAKNYILYDRASLQQTADDSFYRAEEKLVYKFISSKLVFAYDNTKSLFLNSANILIPRVPNMSVKTVMAFLNSELFRFLYIKLFGEVKILKGNLIELPFPEISEEQDLCFSRLVDEIILGNVEKEREIQKIIFEIYNFTEEEISRIRKSAEK